MSIISVNLVVLNGEKYIRHCLDGILAQTYPHEFIELNILDNGSNDETKSIIEDWKSKIGDREFAPFNFIKSTENLGMWPGQERLLNNSQGKYVLAMAVDVVLDLDFIKNSVLAMESDAKIGAVQPKIYGFDLKNLDDKNYKLSDRKILDTCGFTISRSRRITNIGHGERDFGQYDNIGEIIGVEGAAPLLRRQALNDIKIENFFIDNDYFWYGDDLDFAWRMTLFGWRQVFVPSAIAWHDRQTTKSLNKGAWGHFLRIPIRKQIPIKKRRLDWRNTRFTIIKNDYIINILKDLPYIISRELMVCVYTLLFEPAVFLETPSFFRALPRMLSRRKIIMSKAKLSAKDMRRFIK